MIETYPNFETYRELYARFYKGRSAEQLLSLVSSLQGKRLLDICGGDGRLTLAALAQGAQEVCLVEAEAQMIPVEVRQNPQVDVCIGNIDFYLTQFAHQGQKFDYIACQQAVNYWLFNEAVAGRVAKLLTPAGTFAFNTFNQAPPVAPMVKAYKLENLSFVEVSWRVKDVIHHVQVREGMAPHYTTFRWLSPELLDRILQPFFTVTIQNEGNTALYLCCRK